jgi:hypothetical protein
MFYLALLELQTQVYYVRAGNSVVWSGDSKSGRVASPSHSGNSTLTSSAEILSLETDLHNARDKDHSSSINTSNNGTSSNVHDEQWISAYVRLERSLMTNYKPYMRPVISPKTVIQVTATMTISAILEVR